jgi:ubiquinone/menaquinone biosynthesis C-methylase UbiE
VVETRSSGPGEVGPDSYERWRASTLGSITESLERRLIMDLAGVISGKSVLDVGCGDGTLAFAFRGAGASFVAGCDPDARMIARATAGAAPPRERIAFMRGRVESLPFHDRSFDVVTAVTVLSFVEQRVRAITEMARVLKSGGRVVIGDLGSRSTWAVSRRVRAWMGDQFWRDARFTTAHELRALASAADLRVDRVGGAIYFPRCAIAARAMEPLDPVLGRLTTFGAAFVAICASRTSPQD